MSESSADKYTAQTDTTVLEMLKQLYPERSRSSLKQLVLTGTVWVDGRNCQRATQPVQAGQRISIGRQPSSERSTQTPQKTPQHNLGGLRILHQDTDIVVVDKPSGLLSMSTEKDKINTAYSLLRRYLKAQDAGNKIFIVHRLDRDTSGVMVFARTVEVRDLLQTNWHATEHEREYFALVSGRIPHAEGTVESWLKENASLQMYSSQRAGDGQFSVTHYRLEAQNQSFSLLRVYPETGRRNQIRVHLSDIGFPIVGDARYGDGQNPIGRLGLHAAKLGFVHPSSGKLVLFEASVPKSFLLAVR